MSRKTSLLIFVFSLVLLFANGQSTEFDSLVARYSSISRKAESIDSLKDQDTISIRTLNRLLFDNQKEKAKLYTEKDSLYRVTTYGRVPQDPFEYQVWEKKEGKVIWEQKVFIPRAVALGKIELKGYSILITKIVGPTHTYIDLYVFNKEGKLLSLLNMYDEEYKKEGEPLSGSTISITSSIQADGTIKWRQNKFNVVTERIYRLMSDGYFKVVSQEISGTFEY